MLQFAVSLALLGVVLGAPTNNSITANVPDIRIVGGTETDIEHHPWQLALLYFSQHFCGAVEIHPEWALTAAHCLEGVLVENLAVRAGSTTRSFGGQVVDVRRTYIHPEFSIRTLDYDYALLELAESISIQTASAVALPEPNAPVPDGSVAVISGWGTLSSEGVVPEILQVVEVPVVGYETCQRLYTNLEITDRMFCAGDIVNGGKDACRGDAGGPVVVSGRLAGLISWGFGCGQAQFPGVHARLSVVLVWIYDTTGI